MSKRANNEGTIFESPKGSGRWFAQLPPDLHGKRPKKTARSQKEARQFLKEMAAERERGADVNADYPFLDEELDHWISTKRHELATKTHQTYSQILRLYVKPNLPRKGHIRLDSLKAKHIEQMRDAVLQAVRTVGSGDDAQEVPLSSRTAQLAVAVLSQALTNLTERFLLRRNEAKLVKPLKRVKPSIEPLSESQAITLLEAVEQHRLKYLYHIALMYGLRKGELLGLLWSDLDFDKKLLRVTGTLQDLRGKPTRKSTPKTKSSARSLPLTDRLVTMGREHLEQTLAEYALRGQAWSLTEPVFSSEAGTFIYPRNFNTHFKRILKHAGLPDSTRVHDLRHTAVSLMLNNGQSLAVVSRMVGHSSVSVTADVYGHRSSSAEIQVANAMDALLQRPSDAPEDASDAPS